MATGSACRTAGSELFRERTLFALDKLDKLSYIQGPKFVFVHLVVPHPPYVFGPTGGPLNRLMWVQPKRRKERAITAIRYLYQQPHDGNLPKIIANSSTPPIIVIQGDHGPTVASSPRSRMSNLNAYFLPGANQSMYPAITPVNTFRLSSTSTLVKTLNCWTMSAYTQTTPTRSISRSFRIPVRPNG